MCCVCTLLAQQHCCKSCAAVQIRHALCVHVKLACALLFLPVAPIAKSVCISMHVRSYPAPSPPPCACVALARTPTYNPTSSSHCPLRVFLCTAVQLHHLPPVPV
jgi:hypothetical protein